MWRVWKGTPAIWKRRSEVAVSKIGLDTNASRTEMGPRAEESDPNRAKGVWDLGETKTLNEKRRRTK